MPHANATIYIKPRMLCMDEIVRRTPLKDLDHIQLVLTWMPLRALRKLQVSVNHKVHSHAYKNLVELQQAKKKWEALENFCEQAKLKNQEEKERRNELKRRVGGIFEKLPITVQGNEIPLVGKIDQIAQTIDQYQKKIDNLHEHLTPTTPPTVKEQRKQEETVQL
jgi:hypothetical protein